MRFPSWLITLCLLMLLCVSGSLWAQDPPGKPPSAVTLGDEQLTPEVQQMVTDLRVRFPEGSEPRAMLESILTKPSLGPTDGWFPLAQYQSRYDWTYTSEKYDANHDDKVEQAEFGGDAKDFQRLDRNRDQQLDATDFDWSTSSLTATPGTRLFSAADADSNGKVTDDELLKLFSTLKGDADYVALDELRDQLNPPSDTSRRGDRPSRNMLITSLKTQELGAFASGPALNEPAPDFTLSQLNGQKVTLSEHLGHKPVVLIFGNFTCGPFRSQSGNIEKLYARYRDRVDFYLVYVREAHPTDGWFTSGNDPKAIKLAQPKADPERTAVATQCRRHLDLTIPMLVDTIDDQAGSAYSGMPNRLYLIDTQGKIAFKNGRGPFGFHPRQLEQALVLLLNAN